jgi:hypothetical protein
VALGLRVGVRRLQPSAPPIARTAPDTPGDTEVPVPAATTDTATTTPAPEPPPAAARVAAVPGRLAIRSTPAGALVTINGSLYGDTPVVVRDLSLGTYVVQVARPGHLPYVERVVLSSATPARTLAVALQKGIDVGAARKGTITVDSTPRGARVRVDGRLIGTTPLRWPDASPGTHEVQIELAGYRLATVPVLVRAGDAARVSLSLQTVR